VDDLADQVPAGVVLGMGHAGEEDLQFSVAIGEKGFEALDIAEEQIATFIGGEAPGKADGQRLGVETGERLLDFSRGRALAVHLLSQVDTTEIYELLALLLVGVLDFSVGDLPYGIPTGRVGIDETPSVAEMAFEEIRHFRCRPSVDMHAIRDMADWELALGKIGPKTLPHYATDLAVQATDPHWHRPKA
jgi:hypothetical protein